MRDIPVGNSSLLVNFDDKYQIRDIYFPHVGQENHTEGFPCRFGIWIDGQFSWVSDADWERKLAYLPETLVTDVSLFNEKLGLRISCNDTVASHENIFLRRTTIHDLSGKGRNVKVFLHHDFRIYESNFGDTAMYEPDSKSIVHYKKHRYFLINSDPHFDSFATGRKAFQGQEGTWRDAEDGTLQGGAKTEGSVDSTIGIHFQLEPNGSFEFLHWIAAGTAIEEVSALNQLIIDRGPEVYLDYTANYWRAWVNKNQTDLDGLPDKIVGLYKRSLLIVHTQIDGGGAILAANDHDVTERATDHYSYLWTRDGAFVANALDLAGYSHITRKFFRFCGEIVHKNGYFLQKYNADGTVASGWHAAWDTLRNEEVAPIQEDETALVLWSLWEHYERYRDIEFAHRLYRNLTVRCADFMVNFRDAVTKLPSPSWNLWEDRRGIHTFTCSTVVAGLRAASNFAVLFAEFERAQRYSAAADEIAAAMRKHLYSKELGRFLRSIEVDHRGECVPDSTVDSSMFAIFFFGCFDPDDEVVANTMAAIEKNLAVGGGIGRFENDGYMRGLGPYTGNAWYICTLWLAEYYITRAKSSDDLAKALELIEWVADRALPSGVLAEQFDPQSGENVSVSPLTWSHSTFVGIVHSYIERTKQVAF
jgi:oligosaccharide amylase